MESRKPDLGLAATELWKEPVRGGYPAPGALGLSGLEQMRAFLRNESPTPPIHHLTGMKPTEVGPGSAVFTMPATPWLLAPQGMVQGGILAMLADGPLGVSYQTVLPAGTGYSTAEISMQFVRPVTADSGLLVSRGNVIHAGRSLGLTQATVEDGNGRLVAHATSRLVSFQVPVPELPATQPIAPATDEPPDPYLRPCPPGLVLPPKTWEEMSGLEVLAGHLAGRVPYPPIHYLIGQYPVAATEGRVTFALEVTEWLCSPFRMVEGGFIATVADSAISSAVQTTVPAGSIQAAVDLKVQFIRPVRPEGQVLTAEAEVVHRGRTLAVANAFVRDPIGKLIASATGSCIVRPLADGKLGG